MRTGNATRATLCALFVNVMAGCGGGGSGSIPPPPPHPAPASVIVKAGENQSAPPGAALAVNPTVLVTDAAGAPMGGITVTFTVAQGDGSVAEGSGVTGSDGTAGSGAWTMPTTKGTEHLTASVTGIAPASFTAQSLLTSPNITVTQSTFGAGDRIGVSVKPTARVGSVYSIASVTATIADREAPLSYTGSGQDPWGNATLDLTGLPKGPVDLVIEATDVNGQETDLIVPLQLDAAPLVTIRSPLLYAFSQGQVPMHATCHDDAGKDCVAMWVNAGTSERVATGVTSIDQEVDLSQYSGQLVSVGFFGKDDSGQVSVSYTQVYVDSSATLTLRSQVPGIAVDVLDTRTLYAPRDTSVPTLYESSDGSTTPLSDDKWTDPVVGSGYVYSNGAIYRNYDNDVREWRDGASSDLGKNSSLRVQGNWAAFIASNGQAQLRDLTSGTDTLIANYATGSLDVAANGGVAWSLGPDLTLTVGGQSILVSGDCWGCQTPLTDGTFVVYTDDSGSVVVGDGPSATTLTGFIYGKYTTYAISNGWVAYQVPDTLGVVQVWRHGPSGEEQVTQFNADTRIDAIGPDGTIILRTLAGRRYAAVPGSQPVDIAGAFGSVVYREGRFVEIVGDSSLDLSF